MKAISIFLLLTAGCSATSTASQLPPSPIVRTATQTRVMTLPKDSSLISHPVFAPDGSRAAALYNRGKRSFAMINGKETAPYDEVGGLRFVVDSFRFFAKRGNGWLLVSERGAEKRFQHITEVEGSNSINYLVGVPEGEHASVIFRHGAEVGRGIKEEQVISSVDGKHVAVSGFIGDTAVAFVDGTLHQLSQTKNPDFFREHQPYLDGTGRFGLITREISEGEEAINFNAKKHRNYHRTGLHTISSDGKHIAYVSSKSPKGVIVVRDGEEVASYRNDSELSISVESLRFDRNGEKLAYIVKAATTASERCFVVVDGNKGGEHARVSGLAFSPDGSKMGYIAEDKERGQFIVLNEQEGKAYKEVNGLTFSPDGRHYAYCAHADSRWFVVVDGQEGKSFHWVGAPAFSSDSRQISYGARGGITMQNDSKGRHLAYHVTTEDGQSVFHLQVDDRGLTYLGHDKREEIWINSDARIYTKANEDEVFWVKERIEPSPAAAVATSGMQDKGESPTVKAEKAPNSSPMEISLGYAQPNVITGKYDPLVIPTLFTIRRERAGKDNASGQSRSGSGDYEMVLEKLPVGGSLFLIDEDP